MKPTTPHYVVTRTNAINCGTHFYALRCIDRSCVGIIHQAILQGAITNVEHHEMQGWLRRMLMLNVDDYMNGQGRLAKIRKSHLLQSIVADLKCR
jgi:hypothetical protein